MPEYVWRYIQCVWDHHICKHGKTYLRLYVGKSNLAGWMEDKVSKSGHSQISATI